VEQFDRRSSAQRIADLDLLLAEVEAHDTISAG
jgi:hypothetical protein